MMRIDIQRIYEDFNVLHKTEGHKHCRPGWINIPCPFCQGNEGYHLGYDTENGFYRCWRCGFKKTSQVLIQILGRSDFEKAMREYSIAYSSRSKQKNTVKKIASKKFREPSGIIELTERHRRYLERRGFDADLLRLQWGIASLGPCAMIGKLLVKNRLYIPIVHEGRQVSFQTRATKAESKLKYISCPAEFESMNHKEILYMSQNFHSDLGIIVEGVTDVWKLGDRAAATFGIGFKSKQVSEIANTFKKAIILFDDDPQAIIQAEKLASELRFRGIPSKSITIKGDPGALSGSEAHEVAKECERIARSL